MHLKFHLTWLSSDPPQERGPSYAGTQKYRDRQGQGRDASISLCGSRQRDACHDESRGCNVTSQNWAKHSRCDLLHSLWHVNNAFSLGINPVNPTTLKSIIRGREGEQAIHLFSFFRSLMSYNQGGWRDELSINTHWERCESCRGNSEIFNQDSRR